MRSIHVFLEMMKISKVQSLSPHRVGDVGGSSQFFRILQEANYTGPSFIDALGGKKANGTEWSAAREDFFHAR